MKKLRKLLSIVLCLCLCLCAYPVSTSAETITAAGVTIQSDTVRALPEGENLVAGKVPLYVDYTPPTKSYIERDLLPSNTQMTDGDVKSDWLNSKHVFATYENGEPVIYTNGEAKTQVTFFLDNVTDINKICMIHHPSKVLRTAKYEIYAAKDWRTLYWPGSRIAYVENLDAMDRQIISCDIKGAVFLGIKIICPTQPSAKPEEIALNETTNNHYPRICEFAVYGSLGAKTNYPSLANTSSKTVVSRMSPITKKLDMTKSIFYGKTTSAYKYKKQTSILGMTFGTGEEYVSSNNDSLLTDGVLDGDDWRVSSVKFAEMDANGVVNMYGSDTNYLDIKIDAGSSKELGLFYIKHHNTESLRTMHYKIYALDNNKKPTDDSKVIADVYNNDASQEHFFTVPDGQTIKARYYCIRIYDPCFDYSAKALQSTDTNGKTISNSYARLLEVAAFTAEDLGATLELNDFQKVDSNNYGYIKPGTTVNSVQQSFSGLGVVRVVDANGNLKSPSQHLTCGDKVISDTDFGPTAEAGFMFCGDLNKSGSFTVSDVVDLREIILAGATESDFALADINNSGSVTVSDTINLIGLISGEKVGIKDQSTPVTIAPKNGFKRSGTTRKIAVDTETVIQDHFKGFGTNSFSGILSQEGMKTTGYNKVYNELTRKRLTSMKPAVSRMWFQVDWIVTNQETDTSAENVANNIDYLNYKNGIYDFESDQMQGFYDYIEMLEDINCDIEINFGWKTATRIKDWFNAPCEDYMLGAPADLPAFAKAASALVKELNNRGYKHIKAITFYNEPNLEGDFENDEVDDSIYWNLLVKEVDAALKADGIRDIIEIWGPEVSGMAGAGTQEWFNYQLQNSAPYVDQWTGHHYFRYTNNNNNYSEAYDMFKDYVRRTDGNMMVTEMYGAATNDVFREWFSWNDSLTSYLIAASNTGIEGVLNWSIVGGWLPNPLYMKLFATEQGAWDVPRSESTARRVNRMFYEQSLFTNYVRPGSKVLYTQCMGGDIRSTAYELPDGNITVLVESNGINYNAILDKGTGTEKQLEITFSDGIDRTFRRVSYVADQQVINEQALVNSPDKTITTSGGKLTDTLSSHYASYIYTTAPAVKQVKMNNVIQHVGRGCQINAGATLVDCDSNDSIVYKITEYTGKEPGRIAQDGTYTTPSNAVAGDMVAVEASLASDPSVFAISIIYID